MELKRTIGIGVAAAVLAVLAATSAYAIVAGDADPGGGALPEAARNGSFAEDAGDGAGASTMAMCVEGVPDCNDMVVDIDCNDPAATCLADPMPYPGCVSAGDDIVTILPYPLDGSEVVPAEGDVITLPAPIDDGVVIPPVYEDLPAEDLPLVDPPIAAEPCVPVDICGNPPDGAAVETIERCLPPDCAVSSDGSVACPEPAPCPVEECGEPIDKPVECGPAVDCIAPEPCAVPPDAPADVVEDIRARCAPPSDAGSGSSDGSAGGGVDGAEPAVEPAE